DGCSSSSALIPAPLPLQSTAAKNPSCFSKVVAVLKGLFDVDLFQKVGKGNCMLCLATWSADREPGGRAWPLVLPHVCLARYAPRRRLSLFAAGLSEMRDVAVGGQSDGQSKR